MRGGYAQLCGGGRHRFGPHHLATRGADRGKRHVGVDHAKRRPDHVAAIVDLRDDTVGAVRRIGGDLPRSPRASLPAFAPEQDCASLAIGAIDAARQELLVNA
jgi:hypothetical protein